jgi:hypothetical protein
MQEHSQHAATTLHNLEVGESARRRSGYLGEAVQSVLGALGQGGDRGLQPRVVWHATKNKLPRDVTTCATRNPN